jgi:hypothetical protein
MITEVHKNQYMEDGYFVVDDLLPPAMFAEVEAACRRVKAKVRAGEVDVFTHWSTPGDPWCIRGLIDPQFGEPIFAEYLLYEPFMACCRAFMGEELRMGWIDLRTNPHSDDFPGGWHRDIEKDPSLQREMEILNKPIVDFRWYLPLVEDNCLQIVPGSHRRNRTELERDCLVNNPHIDLPDQLTINLCPGQVAFWSGNTIHRGTMSKNVERLTLAASWAKYRLDEPMVKEVDSRFEWRLSDRVRAALPPALLPYYDRWYALQNV